MSERFTEGDALAAVLASAASILVTPQISAMYDGPLGRVTARNNIEPRVDALSTEAQTFEEVALILDDTEHAAAAVFLRTKEATLTAEAQRLEREAPDGNLVLAGVEGLGFALVGALAGYVTNRALNRRAKLQKNTAPASQSQI